MVIHWTPDYDVSGYHKTKCGVKVTLKEIQSQKFEGVFRFLTKVFQAKETENYTCPPEYCKDCWNKAIETNSK